MKTIPPRQLKPRDEGVEQLAALLDHLGRLLAEEYIALLTPHPTEDIPPEESR